MGATAIAIRQRTAELAGRPVAGTVALLLLATGGLLLTLLVAGVPVPTIQDEFAYLLAGDTFSHGRLTNPTHPFWRHFETYQVIHQPSYQAKYPPAQGLFLAAGMLLGHPLIGVWAGVMLMIAATAWALRGLLPARWAFFGALLLTLSLGMSSYWARTYWGGAVAAAGGALAFGGAARMAGGRARLPDGLAGGVGLMLLANSRPLEGLVFVLVLVAWVVIAGLRQGRLPLTAPAAALALGTAGVGFTAIYNHAVTGDFRTFPYEVHEEQYALAPTFLASPPRESAPDYRHSEMEQFYRVWDEQRHRLMRPGELRGIAWRSTALPAAIGPGAVLLLLVPLVWRRRGTVPAVAGLIAVAVPVLLTKAVFPHYFAPALVAACFLMAAVARRLLASTTGLLGWPLVGAVLLVAVLDPVHQLAVTPVEQWSVQRDSLVRALRREPGSDLVIVRYAEGYPVYQEWVYNRADIDGADVVWARSIDPAADSALVAYFRERRVWDLELGQRPVVVERTADSARRRALSDP